MILLITYFVFILAVNIFFKKYKILSSHNGSNHQKFVNDIEFN